MVNIDSTVSIECKNIVIELCSYAWLQRVDLIHLLEAYKKCVMNVNTSIQGAAFKETKNPGGISCLTDTRLNQRIKIDATSPANCMEHCILIMYIPLEGVDRLDQYDSFSRNITHGKKIRTEFVSCWWSFQTEDISRWSEGLTGYSTKASRCSW